MAQPSRHAPNGAQGRDRRRYPRHEIYLPGRFIAEDGTGRGCVVRDYCPGGVRLLLEAGHQPVAVGQTGTVRCSVTRQSGEREQLVLPCRIVHAEEDRVGASFESLDESVLTVLQELADRPGGGSRGQDPAAGSMTSLNPGQRDQVVEDLNRVVRAMVDPLFERFHGLVSDDLLDAADRAEDIPSKNTFSEAAVRAGRIRKALGEAFGEALEERLQAVARGELGEGEPASADDYSYESLQLVEDQAFSTWLSVTEFTEVVSRQYREPLGYLEQRLGVVFGQRIDERNNPYGPDLFAEAFREALERMDIESVVVGTYFKSFRRGFLKVGHELYDQLNHQLIEHGVLPKLRFIVKRPDKAKSNSPPSEPSPEVGAPSDELSSPPPAQPAPASRPAGEAHRPVSAGSRPPAADQQSASTPAPSVPQGVYQLVGALRRLQERGTGAHAHAPRPPADSHEGAPDPQPSAGAGEPQPETYATDELLNVLSRPEVMQALARSEPGEGLREQLEWALAQESGDDGVKALDERDQQIIDVTSDVFQSLLDDAQVTRAVQPWIRQLQLPILRLALRDEAVFTDKSHVVRQVINKLSRLDPLAQDEANQEAVARAFQRLVEWINKQFDGTAGVFERASQQLDTLLNMQQEVYSRNVTHVANESLRELGETKASTAKPASAEIPEDRGERQVQKLREGDWVLFDPFGEVPQRLKIAWIAVRTGKYVFVDALGKKDRVLAADKLAELFRHGEAFVLDDAGEPAMDRAQYSMLQRLHHQLLYQSTHDSLTGLINRREFERRLGDAVAQAKAEGVRHVVCLLDVDQFKVVNSTCGYDGGDALLKELVELLSANLDEGIVLARFGPDQFVMLFPDCTIDDAFAVVEDQMARLQDFRFSWGEERLSISMSVGMSSISSQSDNAPELLQAVESSCEVAKEMGGDRIQVYYARNTGVKRRQQDMQWAARIDRAIDEGALFLRCQRITPMNENIYPYPHYEILLGLTDGIGDEVDLQAFIKAAEHHKRMIDLDRWVIRNTFEWISTHEAELLDIESFSINLSGASLNDEKLFNYICEQLKATRVPAEKICFEVTETAGVRNMVDAADFIDTIKSIGCRFSLDDFGNGMSSYGYLKNLGVDYLKIDGEFIKNIADSPEDQAVVTSIREISQFMDKILVAECVQDQCAYEILREIGVDYVQGFGVEPPQRLDTLLAG